jgi:hypothetical protein
MANEKLHLNAGGTSVESADNPVDVNEVVYFEGSPALRGSLGRLLLCGLLGVGIIVSAVALRTQGWWVPLVGMVLATAVMAMPVILIRSVHYRISNYRIDYEQGVFSKDIDTLELWHVEDLKFHQSLPDRILRIGRITVVSHDETTPRLLLRALPNARPVFETLKQRIITVKRQRGVIKLDTG